MVQRARDELVGKFGVRSHDFWAGLLEGYRRAVEAYYEPVQEWTGTDPITMNLTVEALAIEDLMGLEP